MPIALQESDIQVKPDDLQPTLNENNGSNKGLEEELSVFLVCGGLMAVKIENRIALRKNRISVILAD